MDSEAIWLLAAVFAQVALIFSLGVRLGFVRVPLIMRGEVKLGAVALSRSAWPEKEQKVANAFDNQFQLPVLFFAGAVIALNFGPIWIESILALLFVASRFVHAIIHVTTNNVVRRFWAYSIGFALLAAFWLILAGRFTIVALLFGRA